MNPTPACRHLHTDGRPCGSPALRGEPFCFHHHTARKPMPRREDHTAPAGLFAPQLPAPDDFPAIQRALGEVLRLLANGSLTDARAQALFKGLAIASQNLARHHRREEKLAALGLLQPQVTAYINHPTHGTLAPEPASPTQEETGCPTFGTVSSSQRWDLADNQTACPESTGCPILTTASSSLGWDSGEPETPLPDPIPVLTPDPSPTTSYDQTKTIEINNYFQALDDQRRQRWDKYRAQAEAELEPRLHAEIQALLEDRFREREAELQIRFSRREAELEARFQTQLPIDGCPTFATVSPSLRWASPEPNQPSPISIQQNQDLSPIEDNRLALAS